MATVTRKSSPELARLKTAAKELGGMEVKVGYFEDQSYPAKPPKSKNGKGSPAVPVAYIAAIQELGYPEGGIPSRSYMRTTIAAKQQEWSELTAKAARGIAKGTRTAKQVGDVLGSSVAGDMRRTLADLQEPALSERTLAARRKRGNSATKPLIDEYHYLFKALTHTVEIK